jgi:hypothetical protein
MLDPHREIQALVDSFVADLSELAKRIAIEQLKAAFGVGAKLAGTKLAPLPMPSPAPSRSRSRSPARAPAPSRSRKSRGRRGQGEIEALRGKLLATIAEQPGRRAEDISAALGTKTAEIAQPLRRLVAEHLVRTEGARRGTRYFAASPPDSQNGRRAEVPASAEEPTA